MATEIGGLIVKYRKRINMSQIQLADIIGMSDATISNYENGYTTPDDMTIRKISEALGIDLLELTAKGVRYKNFQKFYANKFIHFFELENYNGIITKSDLLSDHFFHVPINPEYDTDEIFGTVLNDNSMSKSNLPAGTTVLVRYDIPPKNNTVVVANLKKEKKMVIRIYTKEGGLVMLTDNSYYKKPEICQYYEDDVEIIGTVIKGIMDVKP